MEKKNSRADSLTITGHLDELRLRIFYCLGFLFAASLISLFFSKQLILFLKLPAHSIISGFYILKPTEIVSVYVKVSLMSGLLLSSPAIFYNLWKFIKPIVEHERRLNILYWVISAALLFILGAVFMYKVVLPLSLGFLLAMANSVAYQMITLNSYISFVLSMILIGGIFFEIPVVSGLLTSAGIITPYFMRKRRKEAIFALFAVAAVITPTVDVFNMLLFAVPMVILFEASIIVSMIIYRSRTMNKTEELYAAEN